MDAAASGVSNSERDMAFLWFKKVLCENSILFLNLFCTSEYSFFPSP